MFISYIIPCFNCVNTLKASFDSIYDSNFSEGDEIILIDDSSTDETWNLILELQNGKGDHVKALKHHINKGSAAAARNTGIDACKNELIFTLDSDNILAPYSIRMLKENMLREKIDIIAFGEIKYFTENIESITHSWKMKKNVTFFDLINEPNKTPGGSGNYLFTKKSWINSGRYNENLGGALDSLAFAISQLGNGYQMACLEGTYYYHRYGYESTYVREINKRNVSLLMLTVLIPFLYLIRESDINKMFSQKWRAKWFGNSNQLYIHPKQYKPKRFTFKWFINDIIRTKYYREIKGWFR